MPSSYHKSRGAPLGYRGTSSRVESVPLTGPSRQLSSVRASRHVEEEFYRAQRVSRCMEEEMERAERMKLLSYEQERWGKLRVQERAERLQHMPNEAITELIYAEPRDKNNEPLPPPPRPLSPYPANVAGPANGGKLSGPPNNMTELKVAALLSFQEEQNNLVTKQLRRDLDQEMRRRLAAEEKLERVLECGTPDAAAAAEEAQLAHEALQAERRRMDALMKDNQALQQALDKAQLLKKIPPPPAHDRQEVRHLEEQLAVLRKKNAESVQTASRLREAVRQLNEKIHQERARAVTGPTHPPRGPRTRKEEEPAGEWRQRCRELEEYNRRLEGEVEVLRGDAAHYQRVEQENDRLRQKLGGEPGVSDGVGSREDAATIRKLCEELDKLKRQQNREAFAERNEMRTKLGEMRRQQLEDAETIRELRRKSDALRRRGDDSAPSRGNESPARVRELEEKVRTQERRVQEAEGRVRALEAELRDMRRQQRERSVGGQSDSGVNRSRTKPRSSRVEEEPVIVSVGRSVSSASRESQRSGDWLAPGGPVAGSSASRSRNKEMDSKFKIESSGSSSTTSSATTPRKQGGSRQSSTHPEERPVSKPEGRPRKPVLHAEEVVLPKGAVAKKAPKDASGNEGPRTRPPKPPLYAEEVVLPKPRR